MTQSGNFCLFMAWFVVSTGVAGQYLPNWKSIDSRPIPQWYKDAKFGIFIHWSVFSVTETGMPNFEWQLIDYNQTDLVEYMQRTYRPGTTYTDLCSLFTAEYYDAQKFVKMFEDAGARYVVLTSKHLEGFCNFHTNYSERWNSLECGPKRDLLGELEAAVRKSGVMKFGIYHGMMDVLHPLYKLDRSNDFQTNNFVKAKTWPQLNELVTQYKPDLVWSDADYQAPDWYWNSTVFLSWLYNESPVRDYVVVNDRFGKNTHGLHGGYFTFNDRYNPKKLQNHYFECCYTVGPNWGFSIHDDINDIKSITELLTVFVQVVSCGGNFLLNIPPTASGVISPIYQERLQQIGAWLRINGEAIYSSTPWRVQNDAVADYVWYTQQASTGAVYAVILAYWPGASVQLKSPVVGNNTEIHMLGIDQPLKFTSDGASGVTVYLPTLGPTSTLQHAWVLKMINIK